MPSCEHGYLRAVGVSGVVVDSCLAAYSTWKAWAYISRSSEVKNPSLLHKRIWFFVLMVLAALLDMPLYLGFWVFCDYLPAAYAFHKLEAPALFAALSLTVSIWSGVLYDLREIYAWPFLLKKYSLISINGVFSLIALVTFATILAYNNVNGFATTILYTVMYWVQVACQLLVTSLMLHLGLKLSERLKGVAVDTRNPSPFNKALERLNAVMAVCLACVLLQCTLLILNYTLSDPTVSDSYFMDPFWYMALENWVPQAGWCLGLLYLCRNPSQGNGSDMGRGTFTSGPNIVSNTKLQPAPVISDVIAGSVSTVQVGEDVAGQSSNLTYSYWDSGHKGIPSDLFEDDGMNSPHSSRESAIERMQLSSNESLEAPLLSP